MANTKEGTSTTSTSTSMTRAEMIANAKRLSRQRAYRKKYNTGTHITGKEVFVIDGTSFIKYYAGGVEKMRLARKDEDIDGLEVTTIS